MMSYFDNIVFSQPQYFILFAILPLLILWYFLRRKVLFTTATISTTAPVLGKSSLRGKLTILLPIIRILAVAAIIVAIARPQSTFRETEILADGIDINLAIDISGSMLAKDFKPHRLGASLGVATEFIKKRPHDRIGLVVFSGEAYTQCPLTTDHHLLFKFIQNLRPGQLKDGTAIGMGLATAVNRLKESKVKSKVIILLTDGVNNSGYIEPLVAAEMAKDLGIKVYTIGVGTDGSENQSNAILKKFGYKINRVQLDEKLLSQIAEMTGAKYYKATNEKILGEIYDEINTLEKTEIETISNERYAEEFRSWALLAFLLLLLEILLRYTLFRKIP